MTIAKLATLQRRGCNLQLGPRWSSFEKFRAEGSRALEQIEAGSVGNLVTKKGQYRILREEDFQALLGLARDVERLQNGLNLVITAAKAMGKHPNDPDVIQVLLETVSFITPALPIREGFSELAPEGLNIDPDDEVTMDMTELGDALTETSI